ncbi:MAG: hypothetical protein IJ607_11080 [Bacteroidaceae bacterium]|nr:hypothetical protein [Bacteroidaceae bacterium]
MCLRTVNIDEARLRKINPSFCDMKTIDRWLEVVINDAIEDMELPHNPSPNAHSAEEMHALLVERVRRAEAGEERAVSYPSSYGVLFPAS